MTAYALIQQRKSPSFVWLLYVQVAGVTGALAAMAFLSNIVTLNLTGIVAEMFTVWTEKVRPLIGIPLHWAIEALPARLQFDPPTFLKDYVGLGFTLWLSTLRSMFMMFGMPELRWHQFLREIGAYALTFVGLVLFWPIVIVLMFTDTRQLADLVSQMGERTGEDGAAVQRTGLGRLRLTFGLALAPLVYLVLMLALGRWLV